MQDVNGNRIKIGDRVVQQPDLHDTCRYGNVSNVHNGWVYVYTDQGERFCARGGDLFKL